jgi:hypothetical protein
MELVQIVIQILYQDGSYWNHIYQVEADYLSFHKCLDIKRQILLTQTDIAFHDIRCLINGVDPYADFTEGSFSAGSWN